VAYDCVRHFEDVVKIPPKNALGVPESIFMYFSSLVVFDHQMHSLKVVSHIFKEPGVEFDCAARYSNACVQIDALIDCLSKPVPTLEPDTAALPTDAAEPEMVSNQGKEGYKKFVRDIRDHIYEGNLIQAVPSHRLARPLRGVHAFDVYRELRVLNPSP
jgi:anthranilate synthase component 1